MISLPLFGENLWIISKEINCFEFIETTSANTVICVCVCVGTGYALYMCMHVFVYFMYGL